MYRNFRAQCSRLDDEQITDLLREKYHKHSLEVFNELFDIANSVIMRRPRIRIPGQITRPRKLNYGAILRLAQGEY